MLALLLQLVREWGRGSPFLRATRTGLNVRVRPEDTLGRIFLGREDVWRLICHKGRAVWLGGGRGEERAGGGKRQPG